MDDNKKSSSWDDLLQDLGAKPDDSAYQRHQPPAQELPPAAGFPTTRDATADPPSASSDWNSLAESLGIEVGVTAAADAEGVAAQPLGGRVASESKVASEEDFADDDRTALDDALADESANDDNEEDYIEDDDNEDDDIDDDYIDVVYADDDEQLVESDELPALPSQIDQALSDSAWKDDQDDDEHAAADSAEAASDEADGGGISGEAARSAFDALFADGASGWGSAFLERPKQVDEHGSLVDDLLEPRDLANENRDAGLSEEEETEKPKRKRSRRRRRGGKGRKSAGELPSGAEESDKQDDEGQAADGMEELDEEGGGSAAKTARRSRSRRGQQPAEFKDNRLRDDVDADDEDDFDGDLTGDTDDDSGEESSRSAARSRKRQSNLPTWSDAIGMIVDGNLEQRAKSPSKPQSSRSRGGRGGGGRRRGSKKPESK